MNLQLSLIGKWFKMSDDLIKTEDYREINEYWKKRLCKICSYIDADLFETENIDGKIQEVYYKFKSFETNTITLGYPKKGDLSRITKFEHAGIEIRTGNPEWGAEPNKLYFVIKHGDKL